MNITDKIKELKAKKRAIIMAHNYQLGEVQDVADYTGDSLELARIAARTECDMIVFCGVHFMAEGAAILAPEKKVLMPDPHAGCPMANMINGRQLAEWKKEFPEAVVVTYVNSTAEVKALTDICCTSANAIKVVNSVPEDKKILFVPDQNLGVYAREKTGRDIELWKGYCPTHHRILPDFVKETMRKHPDAPFVAHPECRWATLELADHVASTSGILKYCRESNAREFIIGTEIGLLHRLEKENPGKKFIPATDIADCPNMKLTTLEKVLWALEDEQYEITVDRETAGKAIGAINRMLEIT